MIRRFHLIFKGRVQGVGFRWTAKRFAAEYGLSGWVKNKLNGDVEMEVEGAIQHIELLLHQLSRNDNWIRVDDLQKIEVEPKGEQEFSVIY